MNELWRAYLEARWLGKQNCPGERDRSGEIEPRGQSNVRLNKKKKKEQRYIKFENIS